MSNIPNLHINMVNRSFVSEELLAGNEIAQRWLNEICHFGALSDCIIPILKSLLQEKQIATTNKNNALILFTVSVIKEIFSQFNEKTLPQCFYIFTQYAEYRLTECVYQLTILAEHYIPHQHETYKILTSEFGWLLQDMRLLNTLSNHHPDAQVMSVRICQLIQSTLNTLIRIQNALKDLKQDIKPTALPNNKDNSRIGLKEKYYFNNTNPNIYLTYREIQTLYYSVQGKSAKQIGKILNLSPRTIECYLDKIKKKLQCQTQKELAYKAISDKIFEHLNQSYPGVVPR